MNGNQFLEFEFGNQEFKEEEFMVPQLVSSIPLLPPLLFLSLHAL